MRGEVSLCMSSVSDNLCRLEGGFHLSFSEEGVDFPKRDVQEVVKISLSAGVNSPPMANDNVHLATYVPTFFDEGMGEHFMLFLFTLECLLIEGVSPIPYFHDVQSLVMCIFSVPGFLGVGADEEGIRPETLSVCVRKGGEDPLRDPSAQVFLLYLLHSSFTSVHNELTPSN